MDEKERTVDRIRQFNRFYTVLIGTLNKRFLGTDFSVTETRILFELATKDGCLAQELVSRLQIDKSYMSRIMKSFEAKGLIQKRASAEDRRAQVIHLTGLGTETVRGLIEATNAQIGGLVEPLEEDECRAVCQAMDTITFYLTARKGAGEAEQ